MHQLREPRVRARRLVRRDEPKLNLEKLFTAVSLGVGILLCLGTLVTLAVVLRPESDAPFRSHVREYLSLRPRGRLTAAEATGKVVIVDAGAHRVDPVHFQLPNRLRARSAAEVKLVVRLTWAKKEGKEYGIRRWEPQGGGDVRIVDGGGSFKSYRWDCHLEVIDRATGKALTRDFAGSGPDDVVHDTRELTGSKPTDQVLAFLENLSAGRF
jgi:hypothetical protein